jgi:uncharacterized protein Yka (UPF0111/DUF47 family)
VDGRDYMDLREDSYVCKIRRYYNNSDIVVDIYFDQKIYIAISRASNKSRDIAEQISNILLLSGPDSLKNIKITTNKSFN